MFHFWQFYKDYKKDKKELEELRKEVELLGCVLEEKKQKVREECSRTETIKLKPLADEEPKVVHCKAIIDGKLYNTEKAEKIVDFGAETVLFKTKTGNYFQCGVYTPYRYKVRDFFGDIKRTIENNITTYHSITPITQEEVKKCLGKLDVDKYIELFGEVEEA